MSQGGFLMYKIAKEDRATFSSSSYMEEAQAKRQESSFASELAFVSLLRDHEEKDAERRRRKRLGEQW